MSQDQPPLVVAKDRLALIGMPVGLILVVILFIVPIPTILLDVLIAGNITAAIIILVTALHVHRPLEFSSFPTVILVATLFRLALNVSVTRLVLLHGYAGSVIEAFGHFVVGGSVVVGLVIFLILIIIQFVVITNGAGRVAEVAARFTLDAMPGKQMAIDADLNAGLIDKDEARRRRAETAQEADFYGAMDGASKFVKGDAIAALVVVLINLIGGFIVGVVDRHLSLSQAIDTYSLLSIGDGLASQIPALLISVSTGIIVTRAGEEGSDFGSDVVGQLQANYRAVIIGGSALGVLGLIPGLPKVFVLVGGAVALIGWRIASAHNKSRQNALVPAGPAAAVEPTPASMAVDLRTEALDVRLASDWVPLISDTHGAELVAKVRSLRRKMGEEKGFIVPKVRLRDEAAMPLGTYRILLHGVEAGSGNVPPGTLLAVGGASNTIEGEKVRDPVYGVDAVLIPPHGRTQAIAAGAVVMDRAAVVVAHLAEVVRRAAADLLTLQQVQGLIDVVRHSDPAVLDELTKCQLSTGDVLSVCRGLLAEGLGIGDFVRILEAMTEKARRTKDTDALIEAARTTLRASICAKWATDGHLFVVTLAPSTEAALVEAVRQSDDGPVLGGGDPAVLQRVIEEAAAAAHRIENEGHRAVVICTAKLRPALEKLLRRGAPSLGVLSVAEVPETMLIENCGAIDAITEPVSA